MPSNFNANLLKNSCKLCLKFIFDVHNRLEITEDIAKRIETVTNAKMEHNLMNFICMKCNLKLQDCFNFRNELIKNIGNINELIEKQKEEEDISNDSHEESKREIMEILEESEIVVEETPNIQDQIIEYEEYAVEVENGVAILKKLQPASIIEVQNQNATENEDNSKGTEVQQSTSYARKRFKNMLAEILKESGANDNKVASILAFCGFKNRESFELKLTCNLSDEQAIDKMQAILSETSSLILSNYGIYKTGHDFHFSDNQLTSIYYIFDKVRELLNSKEVHYAKNSKYKNLNPSNVQQYLNNRLMTDIRKSTGKIIGHFPIVEAELDVFPYKLHVPCMNCNEIKIISICESVKKNTIYRNIRAFSYVNHFQKCIFNKKGNYACKK